MTRREAIERNTPVVDISLDGCHVASYRNINEAVGYIRNYIFKKPFWESTTIIVSFYKHIYDNSDYNCRQVQVIEKTIEKNILFKDDNRKYICVRCRQETEICGFCSKCYPKVYGLENKDKVMVRMSDIQCNDKFMNIVQNDPEYTEHIKQSIIRDGMKNPIIIDDQYRILIGHHRYYIALELGWDEIEVIFNPIKFCHNYFYEGKGYDLYVMRVDGNLIGSTTDQEPIYVMMKDFNALEIGKTLVVECFLNIGSDIRLRNIFIPERGHIVDQTWKDWWINKFGKDVR